MTAENQEPAPTEEAWPLRPILTLTQEELMVLTNGDVTVVPPRMPLPPDEASANLVNTVALRSLMARGIVLPTGHTPDGGVGWEMIEPFGVLITLRETAPTGVVLRRVLGPLRDAVNGQHDPPEGTVATRYLHLHEEIGVIEDLTDNGMHSMLSVYLERYPEAVADFIKPPDARPGSGGVRTRGAASEEFLASLGWPTVLVEISVVGDRRDADAVPVHQLLVLGPGGTFRSFDSVTYHPVDPDGAIRDLLAQVVGSGAGAAGPT